MPGHAGRRAVRPDVVLEAGGRGPGPTGCSGCAPGSSTKPVGSIVYTQLLNERGGIEADLTVTRLAEDRFRLVTGTAFGVHDAAWLRGHGLDVIGTSPSAHAATASGGRGRSTSSAPSTADDLTFGYMKAREISVGNVPVLAQRVTFVGEFGWELYARRSTG